MVEVPSLTDWASTLIRESVMPEARWLDRVYSVEAGCICFTTRRYGTGRAVAKTALLKPSMKPAQAVIYRIVSGWPVLDLEPGHVIQGVIDA